jgi:hypothetical protein
MIDQVGRQRFEIGSEFWRAIRLAGSDSKLGANFGGRSGWQAAIRKLIDRMNKAGGFRNRTATVSHEMDRAKETFRDRAALEFAEFGE